MEGFRIIFPMPNKVDIERFDVGKPSENEVLIETAATLISTGTELTALSGILWSVILLPPHTPYVGQ
ncbi:hypothetical protein KEJ14_05060 [Candidatus Bathyarchaeota archaeon]|nr:hypothetical protein [Candidatus Bathyarchaeota archaeon]